MKPLPKLLYVIAALPLLSAVSWSPGLHADPASHRQAVEELLRLIHMQEKIDASVETVLNLQLQQEPAMRAHAELLRNFLDRHIGWNAMHEDLVAMYQHAFTEAELEAMNRFYGSEVGQKMIRRLPELIQQRDRLAMQRLQEHIGELREEIAGHGGQ